MKSRIGNLASDTMIYGIFTIVGRFITFLLTPLYTNYLTKQELGDVSYIFSLIAFLNILYSFGMDSSFFRFYKSDDERESAKVFSQSYISILFFSGIFTLVLLLFSGKIGPAITDLPDASLLIMIAVLIPFFDALMTIPFALLRIRRNAKRFSITRLILIFISVGFNVVFVVVLRWGAIGAFLAQLIATVCGVIILLPAIIKYLEIKIDKKLFTEMMKFGLPTVPAMLSGMILQVADRPLLKFITNSSEQVAMYTVNHRLGIPMMLLVAIFEYAWKPFYMSRFNDTDAKELFARVLTYFTFACSMFFLATGFFMQFLVEMPFVGGKFIAPSYWSGMNIIPVILLAYYFNGMYNNFAAGFHIEKKTKYLPVAIGIAAVLNVVLNFVFIPIWGIMGAAISVLVSYFVSALVLYLYMLKVYPNKYQWMNLAKIYGLTTVIYLIGMNFLNGFPSLVKFISLIALFMVQIVLIVFYVFNGKDRTNALRLFKKKTAN